jgi:hypothetical protein
MLVHDLAHRLYTEVGIETKPLPAPWRALGFAAVVAVSVPVIMLICGAAIGWTILGFRKD